MKVRNLLSFSEDANELLINFVVSIMLKFSIRSIVFSKRIKRIGNEAKESPFFFTKRH